MGFKTVFSYLLYIESQCTTSSASGTPRRCCMQNSGLQVSFADTRSATLPGRSHKIMAHADVTAALEDTPDTDESDAEWLVFKYLNLDLYDCIIIQF